MGISGLLQFLKEYRVKTNISDFKGQTVAVDGSCWIHQSAYHAEFEEGVESSTQKILNFISKKIRMLQEYKITPIIVFDGSSIPVKKRIQEERAKYRNQCKEKVAALMKESRHEEANRKFAESFTITQYLVQRIIKLIKGYNIKYVIAPYEADSQLAYLFHSGQVSLVITEDSDLIAFGVTNLLYKLDNDGIGFHLNMEPLFTDFLANSDKLWSASNGSQSAQDRSSQESQESDLSKQLSTDNMRSSSDEESKKRDIIDLTDNVVNPIFSTNTFLQTWILAGWDYLDPIKGIGFKTAYRLMEKHHSIESVISNINTNFKYSIPFWYLDSFHKAYMTFQFQPVYDFDSKQWIPLKFPDEKDTYGKMFLSMEDKSFCGEVLDPQYAEEICLGIIDTTNKLPIDIDALRTQHSLMNDPMQIYSKWDESTNDASVSSIVEPLAWSNKDLANKKPSSLKKKSSFSLKPQKLVRKKIPSPFKNKLAGNLNGLSFLSEFSTDSIGKALFRKRKYDEMEEKLESPNSEHAINSTKISETNKENNESDIEIDEDYYGNNLLGLFKRAKKCESNDANTVVIVPKVQTIRKKTFMRSVLIKHDNK